MATRQPSVEKFECEQVSQTGQVLNVNDKSFLKRVLLVEDSDNERGLNITNVTSEMSAMEESIFNSVTVSHKQSVHTESTLGFENAENIERDECFLSEIENLNVGLKNKVCNLLRKDDFHESDGNDTSLKFETVTKEGIVYGTSDIKLNTREIQRHNVYESSLNFKITTNDQIVENKQLPLSLQVMANEQSKFCTKALISKYVGNVTRIDNDNKLGLNYHKEINKNAEIDENSIIKSDNVFNDGLGESGSVLTPSIMRVQKDGDECLNVKPVRKLTDEFETNERFLPSEVVVAKYDSGEFNLKSGVQKNTEYFLQDSSLEVDIQDHIENTSEKILNNGLNDSNYTLGNIQTDEYVVVRAKQIWIEEDDFIQYLHSPFLLDTERDSDLNREENDLNLVRYEVKEMEMEEAKQNREEEEIENKTKIHEGEPNEFQTDEAEEDELEDEREVVDVELDIQQNKTKAEIEEANEYKEEEEMEEYEEEKNELFQMEKTEKETEEIAEDVVEEGLDFQDNKTEAEEEANEHKQELENRVLEHEKKRNELQRDEVEREEMEDVVEHERELAEEVFEIQENKTDEEIEKTNESKQELKNGAIEHEEEQSDEVEGEEMEDVMEHEKELPEEELDVQENKTEENFDHQTNVVEEFREEVKKETKKYQIEESDVYTNEVVEEEQIEKCQEILEEEAIQYQSSENEVEEDLDDVFSIPVEDISRKTGPPEPPAGRPSVAPSETSVSVAWSSPPYDGGCVLTGYRVEMKTDTDEEWNVVAERCHSLSRVIRGLTTGQIYTFRVRAENIHGASEPSSESIPIKLGYIEQEEEEDMPTQLEPCHVEIQAGEEFVSRYTVHEELGKGRYGVVHKVTDQKTGNTMAAKFVRCIKKQDREKVQEEIDIMNCLRHPKLLQLVAAFDNPKDIVMIMEYISGGELFERVVADDFTLTEKDCIIFMRQICEGVDYMHKNLVVHLDLKPENIMCRTRTSHQIKLIDFGLAQKLNPDSPVRVLFGTPEFIPPEIINYEPIGVESDMWSVGVICYVLLSGLSPFMGDNDAETFANITRADYDFDDEAFDAISQDAKDFISELLEKRRDKRLTAAECFGHKWMTQCDTTMSCVKLCTDKLKKFIIRRKWQKTGNAIRALGRMATLSAASRRNSSASSTSNSPRPSLSSGAASRMSSLNEEEVGVQSECNGKSNRVRMCSERSDSGISDCSSINPPPQTCTCPNKPLLSKKFSISEETESETNDTKLSQVNRLNNISKPKPTSTPKLSKLHSPFLNNNNNNTEGLNGSSSSKVTSDLSPTAKIRTTNRVRAFPESSSPKSSSGTLQKDAKLLQKNENFQKAFAFWKG